MANCLLTFGLNWKDTKNMLWDQTMKLLTNSLSPSHSLSSSLFLPSVFLTFLPPFCFIHLFLLSSFLPSHLPSFLSPSHLPSLSSLLLSCLSAFLLLCFKYEVFRIDDLVHECPGPFPALCNQWPLPALITINCGKFWKRWEYQTTWPASWETCMQVRKQQLELDMEQHTGSK